MKKYIKPDAEPVSVDGSMEIMYASLVIFDDPNKWGGMELDDDHIITDGSQVLMPRHNKLWDLQEEE